MKITIKAEDDEKTMHLTFSDEQMENPNYVEFFMYEESYTVSIEDLYRVAKLFNEKRLESK